jgi:hypothetical protein
MGDTTDEMVRMAVMSESDILKGSYGTDISGICTYDDGDLYISHSGQSGIIDVVGMDLERVGSIELGDGVRVYSMIRYGEYLYCGVGGSVVVGIQRVSLLTRQSTNFPASACRDVAVDKRRIVVAMPGESNSVRVYERNMILSASASPAESCYGIILYDDVIYALCSSAIYVYNANDMSLLDTISEINSTAFTAIRKGFYKDGVVFLVDQSTALHILKAYTVNQDTTVDSSAGIVDGKHKVVIGDQPIVMGGDETYQTKDSPGGVKVPETYYRYRMRKV